MFQNLTDGKSDGFALFYMLDGKLKTVLLNKEQAEVLDLSLKVVFGDTKVQITTPNPNEMKKLF